MSDFINRVHALVKTAELEVLLGSIEITSEGTTAYPTNCPGKGRVEGLLLTEEGKAACMYQGKRCPYFVGADFKLEDYTKDIQCGVGN